MSLLKKTILLVEDDSITAMLEKRMLERNNYEVVLAETGEKAVELVKTNTEIDLILMDIDLGSGIDGTEAAEIILRDHDLPLIFLSSHTEPEVVEKTEGITSYGYIVKNSGETVLMASIKMAFRLFEEKKKTQEKEEFIRTILDNLPIGVAVNSVSPTVEFDYMNDNFPKFYRVRREDFEKSDNFWEAAYEDPVYREEIKNRVLTDVSSGDPEKMTWENIPVKKKGEKKTYYICAKNIPVLNSSMMISTVWDVTPERESIKKLKHSYDLMKYIIEHNRSAVAVHDKDLNYLFVSRSYLEEYGVKEKDIIGKHHYEVFPDLPQKWHEVHKRALQGEVLSAEDDPYYRDDGTVDWTRWECRPWYEMDGSIGGIIIYTEVITERKNQEEKIRIDRQNLEITLNSIGDGVISTDLSGIVTRMNPVAEILTGWKTEEATGKKLSEVFKIVDARSLKQIESPVEKVISEGITVELANHTVLISKDGKKHHISDSAAPIKDKEGNLFGVVLVFSDVTEMYNLRQKLREDLNLKNSLHSTIPNPIFYKDLSLRYIGCNKAFERFFGKSSREIVGKTVYDMGPEEIASKYDETDRELLRNKKPLRYEWMVQTSSGEYRDVIFYKDLFNDQDGNPAGIVGVIEDITDKKKYEKKLVAERNLLVSIFESVQDGISILDTDLNITHVNSRVKEWYSNQISFVGRKCYEIYQGSSQPCDACPTLRAIGEKRICSHILPLKRGEDAVGWLEVFSYPIFDEDNENVIGVAEFMRDITQSKKTEEELKISEQKYRELSEALPAMVCRFDKDYTLTYVNRSYCEHFKKTPEELIGTSYLKLIPETDHGFIKTAISALDSVTAVDIVEHQVYAPDGSIRWQRWTNRALFDDQGDFFAYQAIGEDITQSKLMAQEMHLVRERLETVLANIDEAIWLATWPELKLIYHNEHMEKVYGRKPEEFIKNRNLWREITHPEDRYLNDAALIEFQKSNKVEQEFRIIKPDGSIAWLQDKVSLVFDDEGKPIRLQGMAKDITIKKMFYDSIKIFSEWTCLNIDYQYITDTLQTLSGAEYVALNLIEEDGYKFKTIALSGVGKNMEKVVSLLGFNPVGKSWDYDREKEEKIKKNKTTIFKSLSDLTGEILPETVVYTLQNMFSIGESAVIKIIKENKAVGDFTLLFRKGCSLNKQVNLETYADIVGILLERIKFENELKLKTDFMENMMDNMLDLVAVSDLCGNYKYASKRYQDFGYESHSLIGKNIMDFVHPDDLPIIAEKFNRHVKNTKKGRAEYRFKCADGTHVWFETVGTFFFGNQNNPPEIILSTRDISDAKKQAEELEGFFTVNLDLLCIADLKGNFLKVNEAWSRILGYSTTELSGKSFLDFVHPDDIQATVDAMSILGQGVEVLNFINRYRAKDGLYRYIEWRSHPKENLIYAAARDITERIKMQEELITQLSEKELLLREIHHRVKNNIAGIEGLLALQIEESDEIAVVKALSNALSRTQSIRVLYENLLSDDNYQMISSKDYLENLIDSIIGLFPISSKVTIEKNIENFKIKASTMISIGIIVNELITNVLKYAFCQKNSGNVLISFERDDNRGILIVQDNGIGVDAEMTSESSSGFGLKLVKMLSESLRGDFKIENYKGTQCTLTFEIRES